jgi:hypothetical protein
VAVVVFVVSTFSSVLPQLESNITLKDSAITIRGAALLPFTVLVFKTLTLRFFRG